MSTLVKRRREAASFLSTFIGAAGELLVDTTNNRVQVHDGVTAGGFPAAKLSEVPCPPSAHGAAIEFHVVEELLSGLTGPYVTTAAKLPLGAMLFGVSSRVITTITGPTTFRLDMEYDFNGAGTTAGEFGAALPVAAGSVTSVMIAVPRPYAYAASGVRVRAVSTNFTGGAIRVAMHYMTIAGLAS
jgi:hypothetical protein